MYNRIKIGKIGDSRTIDFAEEELVRYIKRIDTNLIVDCFKFNSFFENDNKIIYLGVDENNNHFSNIEDKNDDAVYISVKDGEGVITGTNERSVLIAVYMFLRLLGCEWVYPGKNGERIPQKDLSNINVEYFHLASKKHRGVCIEGANNYENIYDMIDYLPKLGMNEYFIQFSAPSYFFENWYTNPMNRNLPKETILQKEIFSMTARLEEEIKKRSLTYHKVGHGWTCEPFGIEGRGWNTLDDSSISDDVRPYLAEISGKRTFFKGVPLNTNLCYSNKKVRDIVTDAVVKYCRENKYVDMLHLWLADDVNNQCECIECVKKRPSDWYVLMLNELDKKLEKEDLDVKIVFLTYVDLLWWPLEYKIENPDRFVLMFAPVTRVYSSKEADYLNFSGTLQPYTRNELNMPESYAQNIAHLREWQKIFKGDSFLFDYHMMWAYTADFSGEDCAKTLHTDVKLLNDIGLNGMNSCQVQRTFLPTGLSFYVMAKTLWNTECDFDTVSDYYYDKTYGQDGIKIRSYFKFLSDLLPTFEGTAHGQLQNKSGAICKDYEKLRRETQMINEFVEKNSSIESTYQESYQLLSVHIKYMLAMLDMFECVDQNDVDNVKRHFDIAMGILEENEIKFQKLYDFNSQKGCWTTRLKMLFGEKFE